MPFYPCDTCCDIKVNSEHTVKDTIDIYASSMPAMLGTLYGTLSRKLEDNGGCRPCINQLKNLER